MCILHFVLWYLFFFKQKTAYEMRISDWSSDVCSSDLQLRHGLTRSGDAEDRLELAGGNDNSRRGDETRHDRVGQEIGEKSELQLAHQQPENAGKQGEIEGCGDKLSASWRGDAAGCSQRLGGNDRHRTHRERPTGPETSD